MLGWVAWLFLAYTIEAVRLTASVPYASVNLGRISSGAVWAYHGLLLVGAWIMKQDASKRQTWWRKLTGNWLTKAVLGVLAIVLLLVWIAAASLPDGKLHVVFFDVGQGDAIFIETLGGVQILIDGGPESSALLSELGRQIPFWDRTLDLVVLTHPEADHFTGLIPALERYDVRAVVVREGDHETDLVTTWKTILAVEGATLIRGEAGTRMELSDSVTLEILHPGPELVEGGDAGAKNNSVVTRHLWRCALFAARDIEAKVKRALARSGAYMCSTVLKAPHHGSKTSSSQASLDAVRPQVAVISVGQDNCTDRNGQVTVTSDGNG